MIISYKMIRQILELTFLILVSVYVKKQILLCYAEVELINKSTKPPDFNDAFESKYMVHVYFDKN